MSEQDNSITGNVHLITEASVVPASARAFAAPIERLWDKGLPSGSKTGWISVDRHYTVAPGQLTVVTGWPGSGKSEWLDALLMNLARQGWRFALFSPENYPSEIHVAKLLEKFLGKPFGHGPTPRMTKEEMREAMVEIDEWFDFIVPSVTSEQTNFSIDQILGAAEASFRLHGLWHGKENPLGVVIDPWNELEHLRPKHMSETEYVSATLSGVRAWARMHNVHVWIIAHPQKLQRDKENKLPVPRPDAISGSIHWWNKADNAITVWRPLDDTGSQDVAIYIWKIRFKHIGRPGEVHLDYDRISGRYHEQVKKGLRVVTDAEKGIDF